MKTLIYGGTICTMQKDNPFCEALLIENESILATGTTDELTQASDISRRICLDGHTLLPAFIDAHSHFTQVALSFLQVPLGGISTVAGLKTKFHEYLKETHTPEGTWLIARDYDNTLMPNGKNPSLEMLDMLAPNYPLVIHHKSGHMGLFNTLALQRLGITEHTPAPSGGQIEHDSHGHLTGYLEENAFFTYLRKTPVPDASVFPNACQQALELYHSHGITTIQEGMLTKEMFPLYQLLFDSGQIQTDLIAYSSLADYQDAKYLFLANRNSSSKIHLGGIKIFLDGSPQGRTAWMRTAYEDCDDYFGYGTLSDEEVLLAMELAASEGQQLLAHCNGDAAAQQFLRCLRQCEMKYPILKMLKPVLIHGQLLGIDQLKEIKELGVIPSFFVAHVLHWGDVHIQNFGFKRAEHISPAASALQIGLPITFHQDSPVIQPDMPETLWCATNRQTTSGRTLGENEKISALDALRAVTINAASQYSYEAWKGSIAVGKSADFVVLDKNPLTIPTGELKNLHVLQTWQRGEIIWQ